MGGCLPWAYSQCRSCLPSTGRVLGYVVPVRPDVFRIREVLVRHGVTPKQVRTVLVIFFFENCPKGEP